MSAIAFKNIQKENVDVNNLWRCPVRASNPGWMGDPNKLIEPELWTWQRWAGGIGGDGSDIVVRSITQHSAEIRDVSNYFACVFTDLQPGHYTLSFVASRDVTIRISQYAKIGSKIVFSKCETSIYSSGSIRHEFIVPDGYQVRIDFGSNDWTTLSGVKITE